LVFSPLHESLVTGGDSAQLIPDVRVMHTVSSGKDLFGERLPAASQQLNVRHWEGSKSSIEPDPYHADVGKFVGLPT